jgi:hypothetical protein
MKPTIFLSFGAGVQSSVMLMLAIRGEIERPDHVIWADTGFEPRAVYAHVDWSEKQCEKAVIPFHRVKAKRDLREAFHAFELGETNAWSGNPPLFSVEGGPINRQCTSEVKVRPIRRKQLELLGRKTKRGIPDGAAVIQIGISTDEARRASPSRESWVDHSYPLIDPKKMSRGDCQAWWENNYPHVSLPSSSCIICPYTSLGRWRALKDRQPEDFAEAVEYDERIRAAYLAKNGKPYYLTRNKMTVAEYAADTGQMTMDFEDAIYCAGGCGL